MFLWGEALKALDRFEEALVPLRHAAQSTPDDIRVWLALGWCYKRTGQLNSAIESLETALVAEPDEALLHYNLACYWSLAGNREQSLRYLSQSLSIEPGYRHLIDAEADFDSMRNDPEFKAICQGESLAT